MEIYGEGVLIQGESGVGKSEVAIELIQRGHRIIADDAVEIKVTNHNTLMGSAPDLIRHYMELRGIGVVDVRSLFGMRVTKMEQEIELVVTLEPWDDHAVYDRFGLEGATTEILDVEVPAVTIPVKPGPKPGQHPGGCSHQQPQPETGPQRRPGADTADGRALQKAHGRGGLTVYIGIDVGGTNLVAGLVDQEGDHSPQIRPAL